MINKLKTLEKLIKEESKQFYLNKVLTELSNTKIIKLITKLKLI